MPAPVHPAVLRQSWSFDLQVKLLLVGESNVGKTALLTRFVSGIFDANYHQPTIGIDYKTKHVLVGATRVKLQLWDTAGLERFRSITRAYFAGAAGIVLAYDVARRCSFDAVRYWVQQVRERADARVNLILVGNKTDADDGEPAAAAAAAAWRRQVSTAEGEALAASFGMKFVETSAKSDARVDECFETLATDVAERLLREARQAPVPFGGEIDLRDDGDAAEAEPAARGGCFRNCCAQQ